MEACDIPAFFGIAAFGLFVALIIAFVSLVVIAVTVLVYCKIFAKAGYCWAFGFLMVVPIANIVMLFILAFSDWPALKELRQLREQQKTASPAKS